MEPIEMPRLKVPERPEAPCKQTRTRARTSSGSIDQISRVISSETTNTTSEGIKARLSPRRSFRNLKELALKSKSDEVSQDHDLPPSKVLSFERLRTTVFGSRSSEKIDEDEHEKWQNPLLNMVLVKHMEGGHVTLVHDMETLWTSLSEADQIKVKSSGQNEQRCLKVESFCSWYLNSLSDDERKRDFYQTLHMASATDLNTVSRRIAEIVKDPVIMSRSGLNFEAFLIDMNRCLVLLKLKKGETLFRGDGIAINMLQNFLRPSLCHYLDRSLAKVTNEIFTYTRKKTVSFRSSEFNAMSAKEAQKMVGWLGGQLTRLLESLKNNRLLIPIEVKNICRSLHADVQDRVNTTVARRQIIELLFLHLICPKIAFLSHNRIIKDSHASRFRVGCTTLSKALQTTTTKGAKKEKYNNVALSLFVGKEYKKRKKMVEVLVNFVVSKPLL